MSRYCVDLATPDSGSASSGYLSQSATNLSVGRLCCELCEVDNKIVLVPIVSLLLCYNSNCDIYIIIIYINGLSVCLSVCMYVCMSRFWFLPYKTKTIKDKHLIFSS